MEPKRKKKKTVPQLRQNGMETFFDVKNYFPYRRRQSEVK